MITEYIQPHQVKEYEDAGWNVSVVRGFNGTRDRYLATRSEPEKERGKIEPERVGA